MLLLFNSIVLLHCLYVANGFYGSDLIYSRLGDDYRAVALDTKSQHAGLQVNVVKLSTRSAERTRVRR